MLDDLTIYGRCIGENGCSEYLQWVERDYEN